MQMMNGHFENKIGPFDLFYICKCRFDAVYAVLTKRRFRNVVERIINI